LVTLALVLIVVVVEGAAGAILRDRPGQGDERIDRNQKMRLPPEDVQLFFRLHRSLMFFVNQRLNVIAVKVSTPDAYSVLPPTNRLEVHKALLGHMDLIDAFANENPSGFDETDLEIVRSWRNLVAGTFYAFRQLQEYMVFLTSTEPAIAYGVVALFDPFEVVIGPHLPRMVETTLLPFKGQIVYDGLVTAYNITFGSGIRRRLNESYKQAKERFGIVTSLPMQERRPHPTKKKSTTKGRAMSAKTAGSGSTTAAAVRTAHEKIVDLTDAFCLGHLDAEHAALCRKMAGVLARKRPSPLTSGKAESWASGIVRVVGWVNFLNDPSQPHSMRMTDIDEGIGVSEATGAAKAKTIRDLLKIHPLDPAWTLPGRMEQNPMAWMIQLNGLIADARHLPRDIQEEAVRKGLIPYIPADQTKDYEG